MATSAIIKDCINNGEVIGKGEQIGGIVGELAGSTKIEKCTNNGNVLSYYRSTGGVVGATYEESIVNKCVNNGKITVDATNYNKNSYFGYAGGIVGESYNNTTIKQCYNTGEITGIRAGMYMGGIASINRAGTIEDCYNAGNVKGESRVKGGIVANNKGTIKNCYNIGKVDGTSNTSGTVTQNQGKVNNTYYLNTSSEAVDILKSKTEAEMKDPSFVLTLGIASWKEDHTQDGRVQINNGYPILKWQEGKETVVIESKEVKINNITVKATATDVNYTYYRYYITKNGQRELGYEGINTEYTFENLIPDTAYNIEVYAYRDGSYNENDKLYGQREIKTIDDIELQVIEINNNNTKDKNYANKNNTISVVFNEDCDENINVDLNKVKAMINGEPIVKSETENKDFVINMTTGENNKITLTLKGIETEGILTVMLEQGAVYSESGSENLEMLLDANTNYGTQENPLVFNMEIDNTLPQIVIQNVETDVIEESVEKDVTVEEKISEIKNNFKVEKTIYIVDEDDESKITDSSTQMTYTQFFNKLYYGGETFKNTKIILQMDISNIATVVEASSKYFKDKVFEGWLEGNGKTISFKGYKQGINYVYKPTGSIFNIIGENAIVSNLNLVVKGYEEGSYDYDADPYLAINNKGLVENCIIKGETKIYRSNKSSNWGLVGVNNGVIAKCNNNGTIIGNAKNTSFMAAMTVTNNGIIYDCHNNGTIGNGNMSAGIAITNNGNIMKCSNTGSMNAPAVGGIAITNNGTIFKCFNSGGRLSGDYVGGITRSNYGVIRTSYNTGKVYTGDSAYPYSNGIAHHTSSKSIIKNCYSTGTNSEHSLQSYYTDNGLVEYCYETKISWKQESIGSNIIDVGKIDDIPEMWKEYYDWTGKSYSGNYIKEWNDAQGMNIWLPDKSNSNKGFPVLNFDAEKNIVEHEEGKQYTFIATVFDKNLLVPDLNNDNLKDKIQVKLGNTLIDIDSITISESSGNNNMVKLTIKTEKIENTIGGELTVAVAKQAVWDKAGNTNLDNDNIINGKIEIKANPSIEVNTPVIGQKATLQVTNTNEFTNNTTWQWYYKLPNTEEKIEIEGATTPNYELSAEKAFELEGSSIYCVATVEEQQFESKLKTLSLSYEISDEEELKGMRNLVNTGKTLKDRMVTLKNDIELTENWTSIANFEGTFGGNGFSIRNISLPLFDTNNGTIENLGIENMNIVAGSKVYEVGGLAGKNNGIIRNCHASGTVTAIEPNNVGGIVGINNGTIQDCYNAGVVTGGENFVGGIVGSNSGSGTIQNCYNSGNITAKAAGGIVARSVSGTVQSCYNIGTINGTSYAGGIIGNYYENETTANNSYYLDTSVSTSTDDAIAKTEQEMKDPQFVLLLGIENWKEDTGYISEEGSQVLVNNGYPILKWQEGKETVIIEEQEVTENSIKVKVTATDSNYGYYKVIAKQGDTTIEKTGQETEYTFEGLVPGTVYTIEAYAYESDEYQEENKLYGQREFGIPLIITMQTPIVGQKAIINIDNRESLSEDATIKWYRNDVNSTEDGIEITEAIEAIYEELPENVIEYENYYYYCSVTSDGKECKSNVLQLIVNYTISTKAELEGFRDLINGGKLSSGVAGLKDKTVYLGNDINLNGSETNQWTPIGTQYLGRNAFKGIFEGNNKTIDNLYINAPGNNYIGLFGWCTGTIQNLNIGNNSTIIGNENVGAICGVIEENIMGCTNYAYVKANSNVGGIVGSVWSGLIQNCYNNGIVKGKISVGGAIGVATPSSIIENSYNSGQIIQIEQVEEIGHIGGIIGYCQGSIQNCYNTGEVTGICDIGGIVGVKDNTGDIQNCYNIGIITGTNNVGGVVGKCDRVAINSYYLNTSATTDFSGATSRTEQEMKDINFVSTLGEDNWKQDTNNINNGYPILKWQE